MAEQVILRRGDRVRTQIEFHEETMTKQSFKDECDINVILARWNKNEILEHVARGRPQYGDFTNVTTYQEALDQVKAAEEAFGDLPAEIRARFKNDPQQLLLFMDDEANMDEAVELGILPKPPVAAPEPEVVVEKVVGDPPPKVPDPI